MIRTEKNGGVTRLLIDRPERRNAFDAATTRALGDALAAVLADRDARVLVITGAGDVFSTGRDLKASAAVSAAAAATGNRDPFSEDDDWVRIFHLLHRASIPSVAVVRGYAVAGGFTLAMGCDFVIAEKGAKFGAFEMRHGFPASVCTPILARLAGPRIGLELALLGEPVLAERLYAAGLVNRLADDPQDVARHEAELTGQLARLDPRAVKLTRDTFRAAELLPLDNALDMGRQLNQLIAALGGFAKAGERLAGNRK